MIVFFLLHKNCTYLIYSIAFVLKKRDKKTNFGIEPNLRIYRGKMPFSCQNVIWKRPEKFIVWFAGLKIFTVFCIVQFYQRVVSVRAYCAFKFSWQVLVLGVVTTQLTTP